MGTFCFVFPCFFFFFGGGGGGGVGGGRISLSIQDPRQPTSPSEPDRLRSSVWPLDNDNNTSPSSSFSSSSS